ncbi:MAG TPA: NADPH:quinone oxidoreductase family protein [Acidimicrobiales bacterium]|nr:NADPH:quinone oxidoreductase family protein [Acidimicrobiales bacterium]
MRTVICRRLGPVDELEIVEREEPDPRPGQAVVAVRAAGISFVESLFVQGLYQVKPPLPFHPGTIAAGVVAAVGEGVGPELVGRRVLGRVQGAWSTAAVAEASQLLPLPDEIDFDVAASMVESYCTALYGLMRRDTVEPGERVLVLGAGGSVGLAMIDVARYQGAEVVAAASSEEKLAAARHAGAVELLDSRDADAVAGLRGDGGDGVDIVVDPVGGTLASTALRVLRPFGRYHVVGFASGDIPSLPANRVLLRNRSVIGVDWGDFMRGDPDGDRALMLELISLVASGALRPPPPTPYPLDEIAKALRSFSERAVVGRLVVNP